MSTSENIKQALLSSLQKDSELKKILKSIKENGGDYTDAEKYAARAGKLLTAALQANISESNFPVGSVSEIASLIVPAMELDYKAVTQVTGMVQKALNKDGGIGMNPIIPEFNQSAAYNLVGRMANYESFAEAAWMLEEPMQTASLGVVDDTLKKNADFQYKSGLRPKIIRTCESGACEWCRMLEGEYDYEEVKDRNNPVWQRHNNCYCEVTYVPGDGRMQDVYSKQWYDQERLEERLARSKRREDNYVKKALFEPVKTTNSTFNKRTNFSSQADPAADYFGKGLDTNPEEIKAFKQECHELGVEVIIRPHESLSYQPSPRLGKPGKLAMWNGASYSAWLHEMQHVRDDAANGWDGSKALWNPDEHYRREERAYMAEINYAIENGAVDIAEKLMNNLNEERIRIYGTR